MGLGFCPPNGGFFLERMTFFSERKIVPKSVRSNSRSVRRSFFIGSLNPENKILRFTERCLSFGRIGGGAGVAEEVS